MVGKRLARWLGVAGLVLGGTIGILDAAQPNFLVILVDDVGWGEFGFQGARDIPTPHIDSLAANGVRFTQGYVSGPYCSPTRAGLLTGRYQTRFGHEFNSVANVSGLPLSERTLAERLKEAGYVTCAIGKWHLGRSEPYRPMRRGFDEFYGTLANTPFFHPTQFIDSRVSPDIQQIADDTFYTTEAYGKRAVEWLEKNHHRPWFLYLPFNAQHAPVQAPQRYLDRFAHIGDERRRTFAAMMAALDEAVGQVLEKIRQLGQEENTLIFFVSDNGGPTRQTTSSNGPLRGFKATTWEGGIRVPFCVQWKGKYPAGTVYEHPVIQLDIVPTCLAAAGVKIEPEWKLDGVDLTPYLTGQNRERPHQTLYWRFGNQWAIRHGDWKLVVANGGSGQPELYNLAEDIAESQNLAERYPERVTELKRLYDAWKAEQAEPLAPRERPNGNRAQNRNQQPNPNP
ncbi:MAG: N-acetylgalactosamine-6-sulfatase [Pirellulaceae bacterium]|nr:MAG: N-acetylgalactosamine-6-sulfatase [Pirellulaceae bacterium]